SKTRHVPDRRMVEQTVSCDPSAERAADIGSLEALPVSAVSPTGIVRRSLFVAASTTTACTAHVVPSLEYVNRCSRSAATFRSADPATTSSPNAAECATG